MDGIGQLLIVRGFFLNTCLSGVPQRPILGPLLFITYINSALTVMDARAPLQLYADDKQ